MRKKAFSVLLISTFLAMAVMFIVPGAAVSNSFFWQGTDVSDSGPQGLLEYSKQKEIHDALLDALPVQLYPDGLYADGITPYSSSLDGLPNPNGSMQNGLVRMPTAELQGPRGLRIPCEAGECWGGYTILNAFIGPGFSPPVYLIDMDGEVVHEWPGAAGGFGGAAKMLKGGFVVSAEGGFFGGGDLVQRDWCGNEVKRFSDLNNHHDHQREGSTDGYYYPGKDAFTDRGKSLSLGAVDVGPDA
ncbi:MAG: hypothetical protein PVJ01_03010, partial [Pseudomonadota bacterium]